MKLSELKKYIEENIVEILGEVGLYALKNPADATKGLSQTVDPDDATEKSPQFLQKYKKVAEAKDEDSSSDGKVKDALAKVTKEIKELATKFKEAEGDKKDKIKDDLKKLIDTKKDLKKRLDKSL